jgi:hypothetical protein
MLHLLDSGSNAADRLASAPCGTAICGAADARHPRAQRTLATAKFMNRKAERSPASGHHPTHRPISAMADPSSYRKVRAGIYSRARSAADRPSGYALAGRTMPPSCRRTDARDGQRQGRIHLSHGQSGHRAGLRQGWPFLGGFDRTSAVRDGVPGVIDESIRLLGFRL